MKPIRIFTHAVCDPPGYIQTLLENLNYPFEQVCLYDGEPVPRDLDDVAALVFMGGAGNVNQPTDWMQQEISLIRAARAVNVPMLGICLGAQLMSKALGGRVYKSRGLEVGWHDVHLLPLDEPNPCVINLPKKFQVFQWHAHSFSAPPGASIVATSECTECQGYVLDNNMAIQFHLEMTESIIATILQKYPEDLIASSNCAQTSEQILYDIQHKTQQTFAIADRLLGPWFDSVMSESGQS